MAPPTHRSHLYEGKLGGPQCLRLPFLQLTPRQPRLQRRRQCCCLAKTEHSQLVFQELVLFIFQQEFDCQLQRALNYEDYPEAQNIRQRRQTVDEALVKLQEHKGGSSGIDPVIASVDELSSEGVSLRVQLQRAIDEERYEDAAKLRDLVQEVQQKMDEVLARRESSAQPTQPLRLKLGQRVEHIDTGLKGIVFGWDIVCCEDDEWKGKAGVAALQHGSLQPFYHILVDERDWTVNNQESLVAYVAQEKLCAPQPPSTWKLEKGSDEFQHPHLNFLFLGVDENGDYIPTRALREKYSQARTDVQPPEVQ